MSTTPPGDQTSGGTPSYGRDRPGMQMPGNLDFARMPIPGNAEFIYVLGATILLAIIALVADRFDVQGWITSFTALSVAYLLSRGIAKASRVLEQ
jgi:hypothetical protein